MGHDDFQNVYTKAKLSSKHCSNASVYFWHHKQLRLTTGPCYPGAPTSQESFQIHFPSRKAFNLIIKKNKNTETHPGNYGNPNGTICFDFPLFGPLWVEANSMSNEKSFQNMARTGSDEPIWTHFGHRFFHVGLCGPTGPYGPQGVSFFKTSRIIPSTLKQLQAQRNKKVHLGEWNSPCGRV